MAENSLNIDKTWSLFLDRDGVINKRIVGGYVKTIKEFEFLPGVLTAIKEANQLFNRTFIVTNQRGIALGAMNERDLSKVHFFMLEKMKEAGIKIDKIYHCPDDKGLNSACRKPAPGMALQAKKDFPDIELTRSVMAGDKISDMQFGKAVGMKTVFIRSAHEKVSGSELTFIDHSFDSLKAFIQAVQSNKGKVHN